MTFYTWMMRNYKGTHCPAGDLAGDMYWDKDRFPRNTGTKYSAAYATILNYLQANHACEDCLSVFMECWADYVAAEKTRQKKVNKT